MKEIDALLEQLKKAGVAPEVVHVKISVSDAKEIASLQEELKAAGVSSEVHINLQVGPGGEGAAAATPTATSGAGATTPTPTATSGAGESITSSTTTSTGPDSISSDSFEVEVEAEKVLFRFYKDTEGGKNKQGKPVMLIREPRIRLDKGERFRVSATHKEGGSDKGDGIVRADGKDGTYYLVTDPRFDAGKHNSDQNAAKFDDGEIKLFVRTKDVTRV